MANYKKQMEMFELGGLKDQGETTDRKSRNKVPVGSLKKEVRDDVPINISEGEFVLPADVVRYHGLEKIMNLRQNAKSGLELMNKMGQMGNSDQATLPDNIPFQPQNYQQGGIAVQNPQVQNPQIIPDVQKQNQVPGINYAPPNQLALRPSIYSQKGQQPIVKPQPPKQPQVKLPDSPTYGQPNYRLPTGTASTGPTFSGLIGAQFGQLQKSETKKYVNPETGEELFIPFVNGEPVYPIPAGFIFEADVKEEEKKEEAGEVKTTSVRDEGEGGDDAVDTTSVTGGFGGVDDTTSPLSPFGPGEKSALHTGKFSIDEKTGQITNTFAGNLADLNQAINNFDIPSIFGVLGTAIGTITGGDKEKEISTSVQSERLGTLGYTTDKDKNNLANNLGINFTDLTTMARGHNAGNLNAADKNSVYSSRGVSVNVNKNDPNFGAVTGYTDAKSALGAVTDMAKAGYYGEIESIVNMGGYALTNPSLFSNMNKGRQALGLNTIDRDTAIAATNKATPLDSTGKPNYGQELGKGTAIGSAGVYTGGTFTNNTMGKGNTVVGYNLGPGRGTVFSRDPKTGVLQSFQNPNVQTPSGKGSIDKGKGISTIDVDPSVGTPSPKGTIDDDVVGIGKGVTGSGVPGLGIDTTGISSGISDDSFSDDSPTSSPDPDTSTVGDDPSGAGDEGVGTESATDMGDVTAQGGFISRRRATKIKSKKQGGLASRR